MDRILGFTKEEAKNKKAENTINEISRQTIIWKSVYEKVLSRKQDIKNFLEKFNEDTKVIFTGAGSSGFIGDSLAPIMRKEFNFKDVESFHTTDILANPEQYLVKDAKTILVSFGRSGNSPESVATIEIAESLVKDISHIIITCDPKGKLAEFNNERTLNLVFEEINDQGFAMTSSVTGMMLAAYSVFGIEKDLSNKIEKISFYASEIISNKYNIISNAFGNNVDRLVVLGSGNLFGAARESALKNIELTAGKLLSWYDTPMGFRHGPKAMLTENTVILYFVTNNEYARKYDMDMLNELSKAMRHRLIVVSDKYYTEVEENADIYIYNSTTEELGEAFNPYTSILVAQILALLASIKLGCTPDNPFPSGVINRVVQGVKIYKL